MFFKFKNNLEEQIAQELKSGGKFTRIEFPIKRLNEFFTIQFSHKIADGSEQFGLGSDKNEKLAYVKAYVEFLERKAFWEIGLSKGYISTSGIAGHRFSFLAKQAALAELYERDAFLIHWYLNYPFSKMKIQDQLILECMVELKNQGYGALFFKTTLGKIRTVICFLVNKNTGGFVVGLSSGKPVTQDIHKAFTEAIINLFCGDLTLSEKDLKKNLEDQGLNNLQNHRSYWLYKKTIPSWIFKNDPIIPMIKERTLKPKICDSFTVSYGKVKVVGIKMSSVLELHLGFPNKNDIDTLTRRVTFDNELNSIVSFPHPIP